MNTFQHVVIIKCTNRTKNTGCSCFPMYDDYYTCCDDAN